MEHPDSFIDPNFKHFRNNPLHLEFRKHFPHGNKKKENLKTHQKNVLTRTQPLLSNARLLVHPLSYEFVCSNCFCPIYYATQTLTLVTRIRVEMEHLARFLAWPPTAANALKVILGSIVILVRDIFLFINCLLGSAGAFCTVVLTDMLALLLEMHNWVDSKDLFYLKLLQDLLWVLLS